MAGDERASETVCSAQSTLRPRSSAIERMLAIASLRDLVAERARDVLALAADRRRRADVRARGHERDVAASVMNVPALAARPPDGATHTIVGSGASRSAQTIFCVASRLPPGVLSRMIDGRGAVGGGLRDALLEVAREHVVHDAGRRQHDDVAARGADGRPGEQPDEPEQEREREQEPADTTGHGDLRRPYRTAVASRYSNVSRLQVSSLSATAATSAGSRERALELVESRGSRRAGPRRPPRTPRRGGPSRRRSCRR